VTVGSEVGDESLGRAHDWLVGDAGGHVVLVSMAAGDEEPRLRLEVERGLGVARHLDGVVIWRKSPGFERFEALAPGSDDGPYAPGGILFCRARRADPAQSLEELAARAFSRRVAPAEIEQGTWHTTPIPMASIEWTDGVADVLTLLLRPAPDVLLEIEHTVFPRGEPRVGPTPGEDSRSLLRAIRHVAVVAGAKAGPSSPCRPSDRDEEEPGDAGCHRDHPEVRG